MNKINEDYIELKEYIEYFRKETEIKLDLGRTTPKFKRMYNENIEKGNVTIKKDTVYLRKRWVIESIELLKKSINIIDVIKKLEEYKYMKIEYINRHAIETRCQTYKIPLMHRRHKYISNEDFKLILKGIKEVYDKECINSNQLLDLMNSKFKGITFHNCSKLIYKFIRDNDLEVIKRNYIGNLVTPIIDLYPKETVDKAIENVKTRCEEYVVRCVNLSFDEYYNLSDEEFEHGYKELTDSEFNEISGYIDNNTKFRNCRRVFNDTDVKCIWIHQRAMYVSVKEYNEFSEFKKNYVNRSQLEEQGIDTKNFVNFLKNNNFPMRYYKQRVYIHKEYIPRYVKLRTYLSDKDNANTIYDRFMIKFNYLDCDKKNQFINFNRIYSEFVKQNGRNYKNINRSTRLFNAYKALLDCLEKDLVLKNKEENNKLFRKVLLNDGKTVNTRNEIIIFNNYLINNKGFDLNKLSDIKEKVSLKLYEQEEFINLLIKLIDIVADKGNIKKLYRNWNVSSVVTYIFMHYTLAWRRTDLANQLTAPILQNIEGITDGESFIRWLEDGNEITDRMANDICNELEYRTKRLKLEASKNNQELSCVISSSLAKEVATLICICEANRQIHTNRIMRPRIGSGIFNHRYLEPIRIQKVMKENFDIDINEILDGGFDNRRMNKGFLSLVKEKAEELGLMYSYYYAQVLRGHKSNSGQLAETTKIYLKKDINKASLMAFSMGTMGSVAHIILQLISSEYKDKDLIDQIKTHNGLGLTPYTLERNIEKITNKIAIMRNEIDQYFRSGAQKEEFFKRLIFGQGFYGINQKTKCLLKITQKDEQGIERIRSANYNKINDKIIDCPKRRNNCIGCDYMIALRYFIYEFETRFNRILNDLESCEYELDRKIIIHSINSNYVPVINELAMVLGDEVNNIIDTERFMTLAADCRGE